MAKCELNCKCKRHTPWNKGVPHSTETRRRISAALKGHAVWNTGLATGAQHLQQFRFRPGHTPHNKGAVMSPALRERSSLVHKGQVVTAEQRARISAALKGRPKSAAHRKAAKEGLHRHGDMSLPDCQCAVHRKDFTVSKLSGLMIDTFLQDFPEVIPEQEFGRCRIDAYLPPPYHLAFEADGDYWHRVQEEHRPGYYQRRDAYLTSRFGLVTIRLTESEINEAAGV